MSPTNKRPLHPRRKPCPNCRAKPNEPCRTRVGTVLEEIHCTERVVNRPMRATSTTTTVATDSEPEAVAEVMPEPTIEGHPDTTKTDTDETDTDETDTAGAPNKSKARSTPRPPEHPEESEVLKGGLSIPAGSVGTPISAAPTSLEPQPEPSEDDAGVPNEPADEALEKETSGKPVTEEAVTEKPVPGEAEDLDFDDEEYLFTSRKKPKPEKAVREPRKGSGPKTTGSPRKQAEETTGDLSLF